MAKPDTPQRYVVLHSRATRILHWTWAVGVIILIGSGWRIYNQEPFFGFQFPLWLTIGGDPENAQRVHNDVGHAGALLWHFFAMWLLAGSIIAYVIYGFVSGHFRRKYWPIRPRDVIADIKDFFKGKLAHDLGTRNAVQKLMYSSAIALMLFMVWTGLVLWKPHNFSELGVPLGGYEGAHYLHFFGMSGLVIFIIVHLLLTALVPKVLPPMITGTAKREDVPASVQGEQT